MTCQPGVLTETLRASWTPRHDVSGNQGREHKPPRLCGQPFTRATSTFCENCEMLQARSTAAHHGNFLPPWLGRSSLRPHVAGCACPPPYTPTSLPPKHNLASQGLRKDPDLHFPSREGCTLATLWSFIRAMVMVLFGAPGDCCRAGGQRHVKCPWMKRWSADFLPFRSDNHWSSSKNELGFPTVLSLVLCSERRRKQDTGPASGEHLSRDGFLQSFIHLFNKYFLSTNYVQSLDCGHLGYKPKQGSLSWRTAILGKHTCIFIFGIVTKSKLALPATQQPINQRRGTEARNMKCVGKLVDQENGRLMSQNSHLIWAWMPGFSVDQRQGGKER